MNTFPKTLDEAVAQAIEATKAALADGYRRVQVEFIVPEIPLQAQALALEFASIFENQASLKIMFPDSGAAALAKRDWQDFPFKVTDLGSRFTPVDTQVDTEDEAFLLVCPSAVEIAQVEKLCNLAGDRPVVLLIPQLEDVAVVGIGYAARQIRERFISTLYSAYYLRPLEGAAILRSHPSNWQVWLYRDDEYELVAEEAQKPMGDGLERLLLQFTSTEEEAEKTSSPRKSGLLGNLQKFLRALSQ